MGHDLFIRDAILARHLLDQLCGELRIGARSGRPLERYAGYRGAIDLSDEVVEPFPIERHLHLETTRPRAPRVSQAFVPGVLPFLLNPRGVLRALSPTMDQ